MAKLVLDEPKTEPRLVLDEPRKDFGMVALPRERLLGVWDYNRQLDALLGDPEKPLEDFIPLDVKYDFGRIIGMTEKPDETKAKMRNSLYYSILFGTSPRNTFNILDELNEIAFNKPIDVQKALKEYSDYYKGAKNYVGAIKHGLRRANVMAEKQIGGLAKMVGEFITPQEGVRPLFPALNEWEKRNADKLKKWSDMILADVEEYYKENKAETIQILPGIGYWETLKQYITKPVNLVQGIVESGPLMLEGVLGITIGGPAGGIALMAVPIWGDVYADARAEGTEPLPAMAQAILTGTGEAAVEQWTLGRKLGLMRNYRNIVADGLPKILWEGTKAFFRGTAEEGSQEFNRNFWQWVFTDRSQQWTENVAESMAAGGPIEMVMAGAFSVAGAVGPVVPKEQQLERLDKIQEAVQAEPTLTEEHRAEIQKELDIVREQVEQDQFKAEVAEMDKELAGIQKGAMAETPPTEAIPTPQPSIEAKKPAEVAEIPPITPEAIIERPAEKVRASFDKYKKAMPNATEQEIVEALVADGLRPPKDMLKKYEDLPAVAEIIEQDKIDQIIKKQAKPKAVEVAPELEPLAKETRKFKSAEEYAERAIVLDPVLSKDFPINKINLGTEYAKKELAKAQKEIAEGISLRISNEPIRLFYNTKDSTYSIVDGFHRIVRAQNKGKSVIDANLEITGEKQQLIDFYNQLAKPPTVAKAEPTKVEKKEALGLTTEEQKEYKRLKEIEEIMRKKGLGAISKESAERKRIVELEEKMALAKAAEPKKSKLRQKIQVVAALKGLTKKALSELKLKHTGYRNIEGKIAEKKITTEQLDNLLSAVLKARPKRIGYKRVITKKTENKIQSLKENLIKKTQMTEKHFDEILEIEIHDKEPKYIDAKNFITETQGKDILRRMLDTAEIVRLTESFEQAIAKNPEIADRVKLLDSRIEKAPKRDPYSLESMRYYNQQAEIKTGSPIFTSYMDLMDTHLEITKTRTATWKRLEKTTEKFKEIAKDKEALQRVGDYIASQSTLKEKPSMPTDITTDEIKLAKEIQKILKEYRLKVRVAKFYNWYYYNQPIPDQDRYAKEITKAVDIYEGKGREELIEYLDTQEWGVVRSGYEPLEILFHKIRPYTTGPTAVGKGHIKIRTDIEYHKQERNILQRLSAYMRQIDMLYNLSPKINAYVRLFDDNAGKFSEWGKVKNDIEIFLRNLKRYNIEGGFFERMIARAYSQAMRVIIMPSPVLSFRNLFQNAAFEHDKSILIDPRNTKLTAKDIEYLETYVLQTRAMVEEYFMVGEKPLPGLRFLTKLIDKLKLYPYSDITNRHWSFWAKTNQVDRALTAESVKQMMTEAKFEDMKELEQRRALAILARDGKEAMTQYVGRVHVDDIHFLYERSQRSPAEMTSLGKIVGNLMLFPRAYGEKLAHAANKTLKGKTYEEQWRGLKTIFAVVGGGLIVGSIYMKITGRKRNPYNPLEILAFRPGGLAWGSVEAATEIYANILSAAKGDSRSLAALTVAIPRAADMFIPFYDYSLRAIEAATDQKNIDRRALRQIRMMIDKEYNIRGGAYKVKRNTLEKWQYFIAGAGVDVKDEKKGKPRKVIE